MKVRGPLRLHLLARNPGEQFGFAQMAASHLDLNFSVEQTQHDGINLLFCAEFPISKHASILLNENLYWNSSSALLDIRSDASLNEGGDFHAPSLPAECSPPRASSSEGEANRLQLTTISVPSQRRAF